MNIWIKSDDISRTVTQRNNRQEVIEGCDSPPPEWTWHIKDEEHFSARNIFGF